MMCLHKLYREIYIQTLICVSLEILGIKKNILFDRRDITNFVRLVIAVLILCEIPSFPVLFWMRAYHLVLKKIAICPVSFIFHSNGLFFKSAIIKCEKAEISNNTACIIRWGIYVHTSRKNETWNVNASANGVAVANKLEIHDVVD